MSAEFECAAVIGLGLMGGSIARDLAARGTRVLGYDRDLAALDAAVAEGVVSAALDASLAGIPEGALVVLAVPVDTAVELAIHRAPQLARAALITDLGSTKSSIVAAMEGAGLGDRFVGSHPLAGDHRAGWAASRRGLFRDARVFLCAAPSAGPTAVERVASLWRQLSAQPETIPADEHDRLLAWTSHLPQTLATTLALTLDSADVPRSALGPGGRDMTRLAASSPAMWTAICRDNADHINAALLALETQLGAMRAAIGSGDTAAVGEIFRRAGEWTRPESPARDQA